VYACERQCVCLSLTVCMHVRACVYAGACACECVDIHTYVSKREQANTFTCLYKKQ